MIYKAILISSVVFLTACVQNPPNPYVNKEPTNEEKTKFFNQLQDKITIDSIGNKKYGSEPKFITQIAETHFGKELSIVFIPKPYVSNKGDGFGYFACFKDINGKLETIFTNEEKVINSSKITSIPSLKLEEQCHYYEQYAKSDYGRLSIYMQLESLDKYGKIYKSYKNDPSKDYLFGKNINIKKDLDEKLKYSLYDYSSAKIEFLGSIKDFIIADNHKDVIWGYTYIYNVNAKNRYGAFTGYKTIHFFTKDGSFVKDKTS